MSESTERSQHAQSFKQSNSQPKIDPDNIVPDTPSDPDHQPDNARSDVISLQFYIEDPAGDRYQAEAQSNALVRDVAVDFADARGWPSHDHAGRLQRAIVERLQLNSEERYEELSPHQTLQDVGVHQGDTLRIRQVSTLYYSSSLAELNYIDNLVASMRRDYQEDTIVFLLLPRLFFSTDHSRHSVLDILQNVLARTGYRVIVDDPGRSSNDPLRWLRASIYNAHCIISDLSVEDPYVRDGLEFAYWLDKPVVAFGQNAAHEMVPMSRNWRFISYEDQLTASDQFVLKFLRAITSALSIDIGVISQGAPNRSIPAPLIISSATNLNTTSAIHVYAKTRSEDLSTSSSSPFRVNSAHFSGRRHREFKRRYSILRAELGELHQTIAVLRQQNQTLITNTSELQVAFNWFVSRRQTLLDRRNYYVERLVELEALRDRTSQRLQIIRGQIMTYGRTSELLEDMSETSNSLVWIGEIIDAIRLICELIGEK